MNIIATTGNNDIATVYIGETSEGRLVEFVGSVQPPIPRKKKWVLIVSTLYGCPVGCSICDAGEFYHGKVSKDNILAQIDYMVRKRFPDGKIDVDKFKIQFARMGDPALNPAVLDVLEELPSVYDAPGLLPSISSIAPNGRDDFFERLLDIKNRLYAKSFQLQFSLHSTDEQQRDRLIPVKKWSFEKIAGYGERFYNECSRKTALNFALAEGILLDEKVMRQYFDPQKFIIKITPVNPTFRSARNKIASHIKQGSVHYEVIDRLKSAGFEVILSIGELLENNIGSNCGQHIMNYLNGDVKIENGYTYELERVEEGIE